MPVDLVEQPYKPWPACMPCSHAVWLYVSLNAMEGFFASPNWQIYSKPLTISTVEIATEPSSRLQADIPRGVASEAAMMNPEMMKLAMEQMVRTQIADFELTDEL